MTDSKPKQKALCVATRCTNIEQFVATFHRFCDDSTFFVATLATRPVGLETAFSIQLEDKTPVLRGLCSVVEAWATPANRFGRPGVRLAVKRLTNESLMVFRQLQTARKAAEAAEAAGQPAPPVPSGQIQVVDTTPPLTVPIATSTIPSSPSTAAAFATLKLTALAPAPPAPAPSSPVETKPAPTEAKPEPPARPTPTPAPPKLPPLRPIPSATPPTAFAVFPAPAGVAGPQPSVRADATPAPTTTTPTPTTPTPTTPMQAQTTATPPAPPTSPTTPARTDATPAPSSARPRSDATPPPRPSTPSVKAPNPALADSPPPRDYVPEPIAASDDLTNPIASETRTPGSSFVLPANPLMNLTDKSLEGFVDCALYEETGNFFRAPEYEDSLVDIDDVLASPPSPARPAPRTLSPVAALRPNAFVPAEPNQDFSPEVTPLPYLAGIVPHRADTDPPIPPTPHAGRAPTPPVFDDNSDMFYPRGYETTAVGTRPPPTAPPPNMPMAMEPVHAAPTPLPVARGGSLDSTASLIAINRGRDRKRWLVIGASAAGTSLLLLIIVLATTGRGQDKSADAATPTAKGPVAETAPPAVANTTTPPSTAKPPTTPQDPVDIPDDPPTDPNAPPVAGTGPCRVTVTSSPAGSMVSVDDQAFGPSPISIDGPCAKRRIDVKHPRYALGTKWVALTPGKPSSVDLALARPTHTVTVTSNPSGATVSIAGRRAGTTPTSVKVMGFTGVTLTVEKKGFRTETQKLYSKSDGERLTVKLVRGK